MKKRKRFFLITSSIIILLSGCKINNNDNKTESQDDNNRIENEESEQTLTYDELIDMLENKIAESENITEDTSIDTEEVTETVTTQEDNDYIDCNDYIYVSEELNLRDDNSIQGNILDTIDKCQKVYRISTDEKWDMVEYNGIKGYVSAKYTEELPSSYVEIDIGDQKVYLFLDDELLLTTDTVTGKENVSPTRIGFFDVDSKSTNAVLRGPGYASPVDYWMPFDGGIGLHDANWRDEFGGEIYKTSGSHGCVNLPLESAETIYNNIEVGTKVLVHK